MAVPKVVISRTTDLDILRELDKELFSDSPKLDDDELDKGVWWVATMDGTPVAFCGIDLDHTAGKAFLTRAGVLPVARGAGLQRRLIRVRVAYAKRNGIFRVYTYCTTNNYASQRSLISQGFRPYYVERAETSSYLYFENMARTSV